MPIPTLGRALCALLTTSLLFADHVLVIDSGQDAWQFLTASGVHVNDRDRVLLDPSESSLAGKPIHAASYRGLKSMRLSNLPPVITGPRGGALTLWAAPDTFAAVIPVGNRINVPVAPESLWSSTWISYLSDGKGSKRQALATGRVYAIVPAGADPIHALAEFVLKPEYFFDRGPKSDGFHKRMSLLASLALSFPKHAASERLSEYVFQEMAAHLLRVEKDQSAYGDLVDSLAFAAVSERLRPADDRHLKMRATAASLKQRIDRDQAALSALAALGAMLAPEVGGRGFIKRAGALLTSKNIGGAAKALMEAVSSSPVEARVAWRVLRELKSVSPAASEYLARTPEPAEVVVAAVTAPVDRTPEPAPPSETAVAVSQPAISVARPIPVAPRLPSAVPAVRVAGIAIQVGAYRDRRSAEVMARALVAKGFDARVKQEGAIVRVMVGRFASEREAAEVRGLLARGGYNGFVRSQPAD